MRKFVLVSLAALMLSSFANAGVLKTSVKVVKAAPKAAVRVLKAAYKVVV